jgi:hypothetical protein
VTTDRPDFSNDELVTLVVTLVQLLEQQANAFRTIACAATRQAQDLDRALVAINDLKPQNAPREA